VCFILLWRAILFTFAISGLAEEGFIQPQQYEPLLCQTSNSNGQQYHQPQPYEPFLCQT
jgi:hypothetical protein